MSSDKFDQSINRLARNMSITQVALSMTPSAAMFSLQVAALESAVAEVKEALNDVPANRTVRASPSVIGQHTAELLAEAIEAQAPTPDHVPESWKD